MSWLGDKFKELEAQVNPFDNGKTAATVRAARPSPAPAQLPNQQSQPRQVQILQKPKQTFFDKLRDIGRADSPMDQYNRQQAGLPQYHGQQSNVSKLTRSLETGGRSLARAAQGIGQSAAETYDLLTPGTGVSSATKYWQNRAKNTDQQVQDMHLDQSNYQAGQVLPTLAGYAAPGKALEAAKAIPAVSDALASAGSVTKSIPGISNVIGKASGALDELATNGNVAQRVSSRLVQNAFKPETVLNTVANAIQSAGNRNTNGGDNNLKTALTDVAMGIGTGAALDLAGQAGSRLIATPMRNASLIRPFDIDESGVAALNRYQQALRGIHDMDEATYNAGQRAARKVGIDINDPSAVDGVVNASQHYQVQKGYRKENWQNLKDMVNQKGSLGFATKPIDEAGNPVKNFEPRPIKERFNSLIHPTDTPTTKIGPNDPKIKEYAGMLKSMEADAKGGQLVPNGDGGYKRTSEHSKFYSDHYSANNKAPTNQDWYDEAARQVELGKADPDFLKYYNEKTTPPSTAHIKDPEFDSLAKTADQNNIRQVPDFSQPDYSPPKMSKRIKQAENDYINEKINSGQLEKIRNEEARGIKQASVTSRQTPDFSDPNFDAKTYVKQQSKAQELASKGEKVSKFTKAREEFATKGIDSLSAIEKPVEKAVGGRKNNFTLRDKLDRSIKSDDIAGQYVKDNGLDKIIQNTKDTNSLDQYLLAKHGADLEANGIKTGRNSAKDAQLVKALEGQHGETAKALSGYSNKLLDKTVDYGLISKDTADYLKQKYPNYVPFDRIFTDAEQEAIRKGTGSGVASLSKQSVIQKIKGSDRQIHSPLESMLAKTRDVINQGERNQAAKAIAETIKIKGNPLSLKEISPNETIGSRSTISFLDNGKKRVFETTPEVASAAKSLNKQQLGIVEKVLSYPTRVLRLTATGIHVGFTLANVTKDAATALINSDHALRTSVANPNVFMQALAASFDHKSKAYAELVREGAGGTSYDIARDSVKQSIKKIKADKNIGTKALYTATHPGELLRAVEDTIGRSEEFGRAMQYYGNKGAALAEGKGLKEAITYGADAARNNTTNFARAGTYGRVLNSVLPYFNAGIQGSRTLTRNLRDKPAATASKIAIAAFMPVAATTAWNLSDPKRKEAYDDIQKYEKEGNIIIVPPNPVKGPDGRWNAIKVPMSQEVANLSNIVRNGVEKLHGDAKFNFAAMAGDLAGSATSLNFQSPRQAAGQVVPQGLKPPLEALTNQNLFTGNKIVPDSKKDLDPKDQYGNNTSGVAKIVGKGLNVSPYHVDNAIRTSLGGAGQNAVNFVDRGLAKAGVISPNDVKGKSLSESISSRFTSAQGQSDYASTDKLLADKTNQLKNTSEFKSMSVEDKSAALNRLKNSVIKAGNNQVDAKNQTGQYAPDYQGKQTKLSKRDAGILDGSTDVKSYLTTQTSSGGNNKSYQEQYDDAVKDYKTNSGKVSDVQKAKKQKDIAQLKVKKNYDKDTVDLYGMSKQDVYNLVSTNGGGKAMAEKILAYGDELVNAGLASTNKFRDSKGRESIKPKETGSSGSSKKINADTFKIYSGNSNPLNLSAKLRKLIREAGKK